EFRTKVSSGFFRRLLVRKQRRATSKSKAAYLQASDCSIAALDYRLSDWATRNSSLTLVPPQPTILGNGHSFPTDRPDYLPLPHHREAWRRRHGGGVQG